MDYKKDINGVCITGQDSSPASTGVFGITVSKKCDRLATAIYLVTNFLSDTEPMKARLRALSVDIVRDSSIVRSGTSGMESNVFDMLLRNIQETLSLLELSLVAGLVSEMNFTILKREYVSLRGLIEIKKSSRESQSDSILGDNFFGTNFTSQSQERVVSFQKRLSVDTVSKDTLPKGHSIGQTNITMSDTKIKTHTLSPVQKTDKGHLVDPLATQNPKTNLVASVEKESRRARILKLIKDNREVAIKDITAHFADLSEKTIQRELVALVEEDVLKKFGERRWSRYSLA